MGLAEDVRSTFTGFLFGAPCSKADLAHAEAALGEELPTVLRKLYVAFNGLCVPHGAQLLWPLFAPQPRHEALVETNQFLRQGNSSPQALVAQCLFFGDPGYGPECAWGFKRDLPGKVILSVDSGTTFSIDGDSPFDVWLSKKHSLDADRQEAEKRVRGYRFARQRFSNQEMLMAREPNDIGYFVSSPYHGEPFNESRFRVVSGGWDHEHCWVC